MKNKKLKKLCLNVVTAAVIAGTVSPSAVFGADNTTADEVPVQSAAEPSPPDTTPPAGDTQTNVPDSSSAGKGTTEQTEQTVQPSSDQQSAEDHSVTPDNTTPAADAESGAGNGNTDSTAEQNQTSDTTASSGTGTEQAAETSSDSSAAGENAEEDKDSAPPPVVKPGTGSRVIVDPSVIEDQHFWQIGKRPRFTKGETDILEGKDDTSRAVGHTGRENILYLIKDEDDGWLYVESGDVRGFVKSDAVYGDNTSKKIASMICKRAGAEDDEDRAEFDWEPYYAQKLIEPSENAAYTYYKATTQNIIIDKKYAVPNANVESYLNIREAADVQSPSVGKLDKDAYMYVLLDDGSEWVYVESGNSRGFVNRAYIDESQDVTDRITSEGESDFDTAKTIIQPQDNSAYYYTLTSVESGKPSGQIGESIVEYASSYIGNSYVWGGTSLTDGADCSGFVQSIYAQYGVALPRVAADQAQSGTAIPVSDALPGDLVFYQDENGYIYHVMIYAGNGETVEAANSDAGIIRGTYNYSAGPDYAVRVLDQVNLPEIVSTDDAAEITPSASVGGTYSYEKWNTAWTDGTLQKALHDLYENYDAEGFGKIGDRYVIACTTTFGRVGDLIDFELSDGTVIKTVMGDAKNQNDPGCNLYGHLNGQNVIEFIVNGDLWNGHVNAGTSSFHPEWGGKTVVRALNYGNILG